MPEAAGPDPGKLSILLRDLARAPETEPRLGWGAVLRPGLVVGRFELLREVARGGFGVVYEARDRELGRTVAFKALHAGLRPQVLEDRLLLEAEAAALCSHPNIVTLFDVGRAEHGPYLVMELLHGETLAARLRREPLERGEALRIGIEITKALAHAHAHGVIHRDLTPGNVFLCDDGGVKVLDLGMAHAFGRPVLEGGTPGYMAPEQRDGTRQDQRTDVYALGTVLSEMVGGGVDRRGRATYPDGKIEPALRELIDRMLAPDPDARPQDMRAVLAVLTGLERTGTAGRTEAARRRMPGLVLVALLAIVVAIAAGLRFRPRTGDDDPFTGARFVRLTDFDGVEQAAAISRDGRLVAFQSARDGAMDVWLTEIGTGRFTNLTRGSAGEIANPSLRALGFSPDGSLVTFWARRSEGPGRGISVWAAPVSGGGPLRRYLEGAAEYDWTNDGERLVYHTPGPGDPMYVRDRPEGSPPRQIFSAPEGLHGHFLLWSPDRAFIYFVQGVPPDHLDLWRIPASGGAPERLTQHDAVVTHPVFLGKHTLVYLTTDEHGGGPWIYGLDVDRRTTRRLSGGIETYTSLAASADGRRLVATMARPKGTLWRAPFDGTAVDMSAARRVALTTGTGTFPRLGPDYLLYVSSTGTGDTLWKLRDGVATELWSAPEARIVGAPALRRDGRRIAFAIDQQGQTKLLVVDVDGGKARVITSALALRGAPAWTPAGDILIAALVAGTPRLFTIPADGRGAVPFLAEHSIDPAWSPTGDVVAFSGADVGTTFPVRAARADGRTHPTAPLRLTRGARHLAFMPDGRSVLVLRGSIGHKNLWIVDLESGAERQVSHFPPDFEVNDFDLSSAGTEVVLHQVQAQSDIVLIELPNP